MLLTCPRDHQILERKLKDGMVCYRCPGCQGVAVTIGLLRRLIDRDFANDLWNRARSGGSGSGVPCPSCLGETRSVVVAGGEGQQPTEIDVCPSCQLIWLDPGELEDAPAKEMPPEEERLSMEAREALGRFELSSRKKRKEASDSGLKYSEEPGKDLLKALVLQGMPLEDKKEKWLVIPWVTWSVMLLVAFVSTAVLLSFSPEQRFGREAIPPLIPQVIGFFEVWGFVPADWSRFGGATIFTSFFLHAGWVHLFGNLYFLWLTGDDVESELGWRRFLLLLLAATLVATLLRYLSNPASAVPGIGASGGISGVMAYYALAYPRRRLRMVFLYYFRPIVLTAKARSLFIVWVVLQLFLAYREIQGSSMVSGTAHLGGIVAGVLAWIFWCYRSDERGKEATRS